VRSRLLLPVGGLVLMLAFAPTAQAGSTISQSDFSVPVDATTAVAQTFQMGSTAARLGNVQIYDVDVPSDNITVSVFATAAGKPTGSALDTQTNSSSDASAWNSFDFGLTLTLSANATYALEAQAAGTIGGTCSTSAYAGGTALFQSGGNWVTEDSSAVSPDCIQDLAFSVETREEQVGIEVAPKNLDGHPALEGAVDANGFVNHTHSAAADLAPDGIGAQFPQGPRRPAPKFDRRPAQQSGRARLFREQAAQFLRRQYREGWTLNG